MSENLRCLETRGSTDTSRHAAGQTSALWLRNMVALSVWRVSKYIDISKTSWGQDWKEGEVGMALCILSKAQINPDPIRTTSQRCRKSRNQHKEAISCSQHTVVTHIPFVYLLSLSSFHPQPLQEKPWEALGEHSLA